MPVKVTYSQFAVVKEVIHREGQRFVCGEQGELEVRTGNRVVALHRQGMWDYAEVIDLDSPVHKEPQLYLAIANLASALEHDDNPLVERAAVAKELRRLLKGEELQDA